MGSLCRGIDGSPVKSMRTAIAEIVGMNVYEVDGSGRRVRLYGPGDVAAKGHFEFDEERLEYFLQLLPTNPAGLRVLDLGANPYILTYALTRLGVTVVAAGHPMPGAGGPAGQGTVEFEQPDGCRIAVSLVRFDVESDPFPFDDASFDVIMCGELIEHLPHGPDRMLFECNRVLVNGGRFLLSTPNAVSLARLIAIARGANPDWPFSPQGIYARHNRLYTFAELRDLLLGNGFRPLIEKGLTFRHQRAWYRSGLIGMTKWATRRVIDGALAWQGRRWRRFAEGAFVAAVKVEGSRLYRPTWLFGGADSVPMIATGSAVGAPGCYVGAPTDDSSQMWPALAIYDQDPGGKR